LESALALGAGREPAATWIRSHETSLRIAGGTGVRVVNIRVGAVSGITASAPSP